MNLSMLYKGVISSLCFLAGGTAVMFLLYILLSWIFGSVLVFSIIFCIAWAVLSLLAYIWEDPDWVGRSYVTMHTREKED